MKRLIKVAKELNVGISTIVEHLNGSGFSIESKPTAKVTDEMYSALLNKFERSIAIKEKADQLTIGTRPVTQKEPPVFKTAPTPVPPKVEQKPTPPPAPAPPVVKEEKMETPAPVVKKEVVKEVVKVESKPIREVPKLKVLGKINLDNNKKVVRRKRRLSLLLRKK